MNMFRKFRWKCGILVYLVYYFSFSQLCVIGFFLLWKIFVVLVLVSIRLWSSLGVNFGFDFRLICCVILGKIFFRVSFGIFIWNKGMLVFESFGIFCFRREDFLWDVLVNSYQFWFYNFIIFFFYFSRQKWGKGVIFWFY